MLDKDAFQTPPRRRLADILEQTRARLAAQKILITHVTATRQNVLMCAGSPLPTRYAQSMPLTHSICQHAIGMRFPLSIDNAADHPLLRGHAAIPDLNIGAYLGIPFGVAFPSVAMCALCERPRLWTSANRECLAAAIDEIKSEHAAGISDLLALARRSDPFG